jgi:hypothetical protein
VTGLTRLTALFFPSEEVTGERLTAFVFSSIACNSRDNIDFIRAYLFPFLVLFFLAATCASCIL